MKRCEGYVAELLIPWEFQVLLGEIVAERPCCCRVEKRGCGNRHLIYNVFRALGARP